MTRRTPQPERFSPTSTEGHDPRIELALRQLSAVLWEIAGNAPGESAATRASPADRLEEAAETQRNGSRLPRLA
jgi:hypothetical protein